MKAVKTAVPTTRHFGGKLTKFVDKQERSFEKKHLKAYLQGDKLFQYGCRQGNLGMEPSMFEVREVWL